MPEKYEAVADRWLDVVFRGSEEFMCACVFCPGGKSLQFNVRRGLWVCFRCGEKGTAQSLVERLGGSFSNPANDVQYAQRALDELRKELRTPNEPRVLPESYLKRFGGKPHEHWTKRRKFSRETIRKWELGHDPIGPRLAEASVGESLTIPYRNPDGDLLGVIHRRLGDGFPRYIYPGGFDRTGALFGSWELGDSESRFPYAVLVEGSTDAIRIDQMGYPVLGQYGSSLHRNQVALLRRLNIKEVVLFYDYDASGIKATWQAAQALDGFIVRSVEWNRSKYCWHGKLCNCREQHHPLDVNLGKCDMRRKCKCGRMHDVDPGDWKQLPESTVHSMVEKAPLIGRPQWSSSRRKQRSSRRLRSALTSRAERSPREGFGK